MSLAAKSPTSREPQRQRGTVLRGSLNRSPICRTKRGACPRSECCRRSTASCCRPAAFQRSAPSANSFTPGVDDLIEVFQVVQELRPPSRHAWCRRPRWHWLRQLLQVLLTNDRPGDELRPRRVMQRRSPTDPMREGLHQVDEGNRGTVGGVGDLASARRPSRQLASRTWLGVRISAHPGRSFQPIVDGIQPIVDAVSG
jgi:hypothetical protein